MTSPNIPPQAYTREMLAKAFDWLKKQPESIKKLANTADNLVGIYLQAQRYAQNNSETNSVNNDAPVSSAHFKSELKSLAQGLREFEETKVSKKKETYTQGSQISSLGVPKSNYTPPPSNNTMNQSISAPWPNRQQSAQARSAPTSNQQPVPPTSPPSMPTPSLRTSMESIHGNGQQQQNKATISYQHLQNDQTPSSTITPQSPSMPNLSQFSSPENKFGSQTTSPPLTSNIESPTAQPSNTNPTKQNEVSALFSQDSVVISIALDRRSMEILNDVQANMNLSTETEALRLLIALGYEKVRGIFDANF